MLTEGDAQVAAGDSVQVDAVAQPVLGPGTYPLRVVVDRIDAAANMNAITTQRIS